MMHNKVVLMHDEVMRMVDESYRIGSESALRILVETADLYGAVSAIETARRWLRIGVSNVLDGGSTSGESGTATGGSSGRD